MKTVYLALGSNLGDRLAYLQKALDLLHRPTLQVKRAASVYETEPMEVTDQPWFLNTVLEVETLLFPRQLLARLQQVERRLDRQRTIDKGPRTLDIDLLLYGQAVVQAPELTIPHPAMAQRRFVLEPLAELAPQLRHPVLRRTVWELLQAAPHLRLSRFGTPLRLPGERSSLLP